MVDGTFGGLLRVLLCTALAVTVVGGVLYGPQIASLAVRIARFLRLAPPALPTREGPPLERIATDLRRLRPEARRPCQGTAYAKRRGVLAAYDDLLLDACRALEVRTSLASLPEGLEREAERLRLESELERAGLPMATPR